MKRRRCRWNRSLLLVVATWIALVVSAPQAGAVPIYAARTGFTCVTCHFDPNGGGPRKDIGFLFARQRHDLTPDPDPQWQSLISLTNNLGDVFYFGTNTRMIYLYENPESFGTVERDEISTFFQMQGALYTALRPHKNLVMVWNQDFNEFSGVRTRDLYGMIDGLPNGLYIKAGRIRNPFGLRMDDHTGATRGGFLDPATGSSGGLLPFDPRSTESGIEFGFTPGRWFGAVAITNGGTAFANDVHTVAAKWGLIKKPYHVAVSGYDSYRTSSRRRFTRWGIYGLWNWREDLTFEAEFVAGEDRNSSGEITRKWGFFTQADYRSSRWLLVTGRYDFADQNLDLDDFAAERFGAQATFTVVPFADVLVSYRRLVPELAGDENQYLLMFHFYY